MSMSTHVRGFRPPDKEWKKKVEAYRACQDAGISIPGELEAFFNWEPPDEKGVEVILHDHICCTEYKDEMRDGFEIDVTKLPDHIRYIRFYNSS